MQMGRLFETVYILLHKRHITARELAEHFEVSTRTIYRDIDTLSMAGIPIYTDKGKGGGISLMDHYVLNKSILTREEQEHILSSLMSTKHLAQQDLNQVITKLASIFQCESIDWIDVDFSDWSTAHDEKFNMIKEAIWNQRVLYFTYSNLQGSTTKRYVEPLKLIFKSQAWYVFAYCRTKNRASFFKLTRIQTMTLQEETFIRKDIEPNYEGYIRKADEKVSLTLRMNANISYRVYDDFPYDQITKLDDESFEVRVSLYEDDWLYDWLMSYGTGLIVLEPAHIREQLINRYREALQLYEKKEP